MLKVLLVVMVFAIATYALIRVIERRGGAKPQVRRSAPRPQPRPQGPDDDEDFLRDLERKRRHPEDPDGPTL